MIGDQWDCGCGWSNVFLRKRCRNCGLPSCLAVGGSTALEVVAERHAASVGPAPDRARGPRRGDDGRKV